jgi:hypothetical protein
MCASALAACVDNDTQGAGSDTDTAGGITGAPATAAETEGATEADTSATPPDTPTGSGSGDASVGGSDSSTPDPTTGEDEATGSAATGCQKIDLLFVIDNGSTMRDEQEALIAAFPGFYDGLKATLGVQDTHVMAVAADDGKALTAADGRRVCACAPTARSASGPRPPSPRRAC